MVMKLKLKKRIKKEFLLALFSFVVIFTVLQNPMFTPLNLMLTSSQTTVTMPSTLGGLSLQGSWLVSQSTTVFQMINQTSGELVPVYQVTVTMFNIMSMLILVSPVLLYIYWANKKKEPRNEIYHKPLNKKHT